MPMLSITTKATIGTVTITAMIQVSKPESDDPSGSTTSSAHSEKSQQKLMLYN